LPYEPVLQGFAQEPPGKFFRDRPLFQPQRHRGWTGIDACLRCAGFATADLVEDLLARSNDISLVFAGSGGILQQRTDPLPQSARGRVSAVDDRDESIVSQQHICQGLRLVFSAPINERGAVLPEDTQFEIGYDQDRRCLGFGNGLLRQRRSDRDSRRLCSLGEP
jgi:hypothetical protein